MMARYILLTTAIMLLFSSGCAKVTVDGVWEREPTDNAQMCLIIPGSGQFCNEQPGKGFLFLSGFAVSAYFFAEYEGAGKGAAAAVAGIGIMAWSALDAYHVSNQFNLNGGRKAGMRVDITPVPEGGTLVLTLEY